MRAPLTLLLLLLVSGPTVAQTELPSGVIGRVGDALTNVTGYSYYYQPGEATIQIEVWGDLSNPGIYEVGSSTDLRTLLTLTGGPTFIQDESQKQRFEILIYKTVGAERVLSSKYDLEEVITSPPIPLREGDTVLFRSFVKRPFNYREILSIAGAIAALYLTFDQIRSE